MTPEGAEGSPEPVVVDLLIRNASIYRSDDSFTYGSVACANGLIVSIGSESDPPSYDAKETIDAAGGIVHPGLTDAHLHTPLFATRHLLDTRGPRETYFQLYVDWFNHVDDEIEYLSTKVACMEALAHGVTAFIEPGTAMEPDAVAAAATEIGVRCSVGDSFVWDRDDFWMASAIKRRPLVSSPNLGTQLWRNREGESLVTGHVALYGSASASAQLLQDAVECAREGGSFLTFHQSPTVENAGLDERQFGRPALLFMEEAGLLGEELLLAHMNALSEEEELALRRSTASVAWCPANAINWGMAPTSCLPRLMAAGKRIALGSDLPKSWGLSDQVSLATIQARSIGVDLDPVRLYEGVFSYVPRLMRRPSPGRGLEAGSSADLVIRKSFDPETHPGVNLAGHMAIAKGRTVATVIVGGRVVYGDGAPAVDGESAISKMESKAFEIAARM